MVTGQSYDLRVDIASRDTTSKVGNSVCESVQIFLAHKGKEEIREHDVGFAFKQNLAC